MVAKTPALAAMSSNHAAIVWRRAGRRVAASALARQLQLPLASTVDILDGRRQDERRPVIDAEVARLLDLIARARGAIDLLTNARDCPHDRPAESCPDMRAALDRLLRGEDPRPS